MKSKVV